MPIHYNKKICFIHIPKTGGTSISKGLFGQVGGDKSILLVSLINIDGTFRRASHCTLEEIYKLKPEVKSEEFKKISMIRNPYDRFISEYFHLKRYGINHPLFGCPKNISFSKYVDNFEKKYHLLEERCSHLGGEDYVIHHLPQDRFLTVDGKLAVDKIYRFENFDEIQKDFGFKEHENKNNLKKGKNYREILGPKAKDVIESIYKKDFELFDYKKMKR